MSLLAESKRVAAEFEFTDDDVRKNVEEFIAQMSASFPH
jgi:hexokinase